jgi:hypothetical protein
MSAYHKQARRRIDSIESLRERSITGDPRRRPNLGRAKPSPIEAVMKRLAR